MIWNLKEYKNHTAVIYDGCSCIYEELDRLTEELAAVIPERSLVFALTSNTLPSIVGYVSFLNHRVVPLMLEANINQELLQNLLVTYRPQYLWVPEKRAEEFPEAERVYELMGYVLLDRKEPNPYPLHEDLALLITTSGSTGSPKLVRQTYANLLSNTRSIISYLEIDENERAITSLPMNYVYGLSVINTHLYAGATLILTDLNCYAGKFWTLFNEQKATSFAGVPFMYEMLNKLKFTKMDVPTLRTLTQAGGKLSIEMQEIFGAWAKETGRKFYVMYGASEATSRMGYLPWERCEEKRGSMGVPIPGGRFEISDPDGRPLPQGETGELVYYGDNVTMGYAACGEDLAKGDENHGRLLTGDMAYCDADGFYYIVGRKKRFVKILGKRVNLDEMEALLKKEFHTVDLACAGKDDLLKVFVVNEELKKPVLEYIFDTTEINRRLCKVCVIPEIPKNPSGKILYSKLNEMDA